MSMHPSRADIRYWQGVAHNRNTSSSAAFRAGIRLAFTEGYKRALRDSAKKCEEIGFAKHGPGREDSEAFDCADAIRSIEGEKSETR